MTGNLLAGQHILVVEDDFLLASELCRELEMAGATIVGPVPGIPEALDLIASAPVIRGAILDMNLRGRMAFPVADMLIERGVPFLFTTGYDQMVLPPRFDHVPRLEKPITPADAVRAIAGRLQGFPAIQAPLIRHKAARMAQDLDGSSNRATDTRQHENRCRPVDLLLLSEHDANGNLSIRAVFRDLMFIKWLEPLRSGARFR